MGAILILGVVIVVGIFGYVNVRHEEKQQALSSMA
jgi:hypothetical protein